MEQEFGYINSSVIFCALRSTGFHLTEEKIIKK